MQLEPAGPTASGPVCPSRLLVVLGPLTRGLRLEDMQRRLWEGQAQPPG